MKAGTIDAAGQTLDEDVPDPSRPQSGITLGEHDPHRPAHKILTHQAIHGILS